DMFMAMYPSKVLRLWDIGPIIISLEEITCCYLVKCKLVLATGYYYEIYNKTGTLPRKIKKPHDVRYY
ncbi:MAG: hypothetical protein M0Q43_08540, partial [Methanothrix sp.]|nr:hypothetical protein [Methanothrix sp.]